MKKLNQYFRLSLCLLFVVSSVQCSYKPKSNCESNKIQLLLEDVLRKKKFFTACKHIIYNFKPSVKTPPDSSMNFGYLLTGNINVPEKEYYLHWNKDLVPKFPDSLKLKPIKDISEMTVCTYTVGVYIMQVNEDSSKIKIDLSSGFYRSADKECTFTYSFDEKNCKWTVLDSTITFIY